MISKNQLKQLIEPHFYEDLQKDNYEIVSKKALDLLTNSRFDLAFKLFYLDIKDKNEKLAKNIYIEHIRAFSLGEFTEPDNSDKNSTEKFIEEFDKTFEDIKNNGFDDTKTLIPLSKNGSIANGAHRVASAIFSDKYVACVSIDTYDHIYNYKFFYRRNISTDILDAIVTKFVQYSNNVYIAFIWPIVDSDDVQIEKIIPNIVYKKEVKLNPNGAHNLLSQIYYGEEWLGTIENNFSGSQDKLVECFKTYNPVKIIAFQEDSLDKVLKIKENIRKIFNVGKHSIHITDTKEEAIRVSKIVFNDNSVHFLNYAKPNRYISTHIKIDIFKKFIQKNDLSISEVILDSGMVLSAYGLRESSDIDYLALNNKVKYHNEELAYHDEELAYHDEEKKELILNPKYYFYFNDIKFISFDQLYKMKTRRATEKDINDCKIMEALIEDDKLKELINKTKQNIFYGQIKLKQKSIQFLQQIGLFEIVRSLYRKIKENSE